MRRVPREVAAARVAPGIDREPLRRLDRPALGGVEVPVRREERHEDGRLLDVDLAGLARVRDQAEQRGFPSLGALAHLDRAEILLRMGAHDEALQESSLAVTSCSRLGLRYETAKAELFGALAAFRTGQPGAANAAISRALEMFDAEGNQVWVGESLLGQIGRASCRERVSIRV